MKFKSVMLLSIICFLCMGASAQAEDAVTGLCKDGTSFTGTSKKGACRGHKGIKEWYADKETPAAADKKSAAKAVSPATQEKQEKAPAAAATGAATGICKDGSTYTGASKKGACRGHKGIKEWFADKEIPAAEPTPTAKEAPAAKAAAPATESSVTGGVATGLCKDGTEYTGASKRGACRGHKGIKEWYADKQAPATIEAKPAPVAPPPAAAAPASPPKSAAPAPVAGSGKVWVNTRSKIYHCEGSKFFGKTKEGEYMSEADAQAKGYNPNRKKVCH